MTLLAWIILFTLLGGVLSVLAAALFLLLPEKQRTRALPAMVSFAIGALLGAAILAVLPHAPDPVHSRASASGYLILFGDGVHNYVDGVLIAAAFLTDVHLGVVTALAVAADEVPQEVGGFVLLLHSGFSRGKALFYNVLASLTTVVGGGLAYFSLGVAQVALPHVLAGGASSFIYIAVADFIP